MSAEQVSDTPHPRRTANSRGAWIRALERTALLPHKPYTTFPVLIERLADRFESVLALSDPGVTLSYRALAERANRYARWAYAERLLPGETVCLLMDNCTDYVAIWLGLTRAGLTVALLNTHLLGDALAHAIRIVSPRIIIMGAEFSDHIKAIRRLIDRGVTCWTHGGEYPSLPRIDQAIEGLPVHSLDPRECALPSIKDRALYIYTSGTTGLPKAAIVSHLRVMQWTHWFCGLMDVTPADRMYNCLPMYHSIGGVVATGAPLIGGGAVILRKRFSASRFWQDVADERCTLFQYIGELCRYLLASPPGNEETGHRLRLACGNGLRTDVWVAFQNRFRIPHVLEYYASTEGNVSLYNCEGRPGSIGRVPPMLAHRYPIAIVRTDPDTGQPHRDARGQCVRCEPNESGEAIGAILTDPAHTHSTFDGYADTRENAPKILRDVFTQGDAWYRTGDLMRRDEKGVFYFVDRTGDTFRWKGENVSTTEVASILAKCHGVLDAAVYGVTVPRTEGRAGMAALVIDSTFELSAFRSAMETHLPAYARPLFLRIVRALNRTSTFKLQTRELVTQGYNPGQTSDTLYFFQAALGRYVKLDADLYERFLNGHEN